MRGTGRRRTQMTRILGEDARQVTFSKRRNGLFKKASELCTLCAAETAIVVFSPGGKPYSFGHPSVKSLSERLIRSSEPCAPATDEPLARQERLNQLVIQCNELESQMEFQKQRGEQLKQIAKESQFPHWVTAPVSELSEEEIEILRTNLLVLKGRLSKIKQHFPSQSSPTSSVAAQVIEGATDPSDSGGSEGSPAMDSH